MANVIVAAVRPEETGVATGMNTIMRSIGGAIGGQLTASILAASLAGGEPTDHAFTVAFVVSGAGLLLAAAAALLIPRDARAHEPVGDVLMADAA